MKRNLLFPLIILVIIITAIFIVVKYAAKQDTDDLSPNEDKNMVTGDESEMYNTEDPEISLSSVLKDVGEIVNRDPQEVSRKELSWQTKNDQVVLNGVGYVIENSLSDEEGISLVSSYYTSTKEYLMNLGFDYDMYNAGNTSPGYKRDVLAYNNLGCILTMEDIEDSGSVRLEFFCSELTHEITSSNGDPMSEKTARAIAEASECITQGELKETAVYNENSKTWWIDLVADKPGCNPACVVYEDESVEINWRCTGLIPE